ncbi:MAG: VWA domain-containing protein [Actinobacteria bacterium]|nr:MAG: VWA domain-containing protein [Actinomycetota bacterium]
MSEPRRHVRLFLVLVALAALIAPAAASAGMRVTGIDTTHYPTLRATVISSAGSSVVPALTENGSAVAGFQATNLASAKAVVLAIDRSRSMRTKFSDTLTAARGFVAAKPGSDRIAVVAFGSTVVSLSRFSASADDADAALRGLGIDPQKGTALYDAVSYSAGELTGQSGGRVLILLTDGTDTTSKEKLDAVARKARENNVLVYPIAIASKQYDPTALQQLARETGGTFYRASSSSALAGVYGSIAAALRNTWRVEYFTAARPGDKVELQAAAAGAGSASTVATIPPSFGTGPAPEPSKLVPASAYGPSGPLAVGLAVGALMLLALVLVLAAYRGSWVKSRIAPHTGETKGGSKQQRRKRRLATLAAVFRATEGALGHLKQWRWTQRTLERADLPLRTVEFFWIMIGASFGLALLAAVAGQSPMVILGLMIGGAAAPFLFVWLKMRKRLRAFEDQLPDLLITIAASLKAGHSFKQGLQAVVDEGQPPASDELKRVLTETSLGRPMDEALAEMAERAGSNNFEFAMTAVTIQRQVGGSLASLFDMVADTVRQRQQFARKIRSLTAMGRMSAYTLMGIPFFMAATITLINPSYMSPLYHTHTGRLLIGTGLVMMLVGSAILKKIVSFRG